MHGFLRENELTVADQSSNRVIMEFSSDEKTKIFYPFDFKFTLIQELSGDSFVIRYIVKNTGEKDMYYSVGSHYAYNVPILTGETQNDYQYAFGSTQNAGRLTMENGAISGKTGDIFHGAGSLDLEGLFENGSTILELADINPKYIAVRSKKSGAFTKVEFEGFDYCVLWAPKGVSPFACIEPWTGLPDQVGHDKDITKKLGITKLNKGGSNIYTQTITVK
jgi:galactose mutarotase-like enzyme